MANALRLLVVEDSEKDAALVLRELRRAGIVVDHERVASAAQLADALERRRWDLVISDYDLPGFGALGALRLVKARDPELPFVVVSGAIGEETAVEVMRAGAQDYVMKDRLMRLAPAVQREVRDAESRRARTRAAHRLAVQHDVTRLLAEAKAREDAAASLLRAVGERLRWEAGTFWLRDGDELRCASVWSSEAVDLEEYEDCTRLSSFHRGEGLIGRVWETGEAQWLADAALDPDFRRRALMLRAGLHAVYALPVFVDGELYGVVDFMNHDPEPPDEELSQTLLSVGTQLGQFIRRTRTLAALKESEAHKAAILEAAIDAIISTDQGRRVLEWNAAAERTFGYAREEALGQDLADLVIPRHERERFEQLARVLFDLGQPHVPHERVRMRCVRKDGDEVPVEVGVSRIHAEGAPIFTAYVRDMTHEERQEEAQRLIAHASVSLSASLDYPKVLERVARLLVPALADGCVVEVGEHREARHDVAVAHVERHEERRVRAAIRAAGWHATGARQAMETGRVTARLAEDPATEEGLEDVPALFKELGVRAYLCVPLLARGRAFGALTLFSEQRRQAYDDVDLSVIEDLARRAAFAIDNAHLYQHERESVRARDEFLSLAAHELKTPLTPVHLLLQSLLRALSRPRAGAPLGPEAVVSRLAAILHAVERLEHLVEALLDISRITVGPLELERKEIDLAATVREVAARMRDDVRRSRSHLDLKLEEGVVGEWDGGRIEQVIANLLSNAVKYGAGKPVEVVVEARDDRARLSIRDYGIGISLAEQARIFERFGRAAPLRNYGGFGLGLWTARQIVEAHGGTIRIESTPGEGARFIVELPARQATRRAAPHPEAPRL